MTANLVKYKGANLVTVVNKTAPTVQQAMRALADMSRELGHAKTYKQICAIERAAGAT
jgi:hypothetical protein